MLTKEDKHKLVFVIGHLRQGGAQRYLYELCKAFKADHFEIEVITYKDITSKDYYWNKLVELGIHVHALIPPKITLSRMLPRMHKTLPLRTLLKFIYRLRLKRNLAQILNRAALIQVVQIENYYPIQEITKSNKNIIIHLMSNKFQYNYDLYAACDPNKYYNFVITDPDQIHDLETSPCINRNTIRFPLVIGFEQFDNIYKPTHTGQIKRIGIFIRLSSERPIDFFFYALKAMLESRQVILHIFGDGDQNRLRQLAKNLHIEEQVIFEGPTQNISRSVNEKCLDLAWMTCHGLILGYSSIELAAMGVPLVFWNLSKLKHSYILNESAGSIQAFSSIVEFVRFTSGLLDDPEQLMQNAHKLNKYVKSEFDISKHISTLKLAMLEKIESSSSSYSFEETRRLASNSVND